ncbi:hypothetical protein K2173_009453 [Erythroxylum novogranatense]|uniref:PGG domain-containing protein n=1 Tax=Erythroxylum novogranatense TaxID=1862640 RepID=A0AAV8U3Y5_9ROSI|nr:hypothetical protein K2173_009453 [Erythroxylum novogranatense]
MDPAETHSPSSTQKHNSSGINTNNDHNEDQAIISSNSPTQDSQGIDEPANCQESTTNIIMDSKLYMAAVNGNFDAFEVYMDRLEQLITPTQNSILHVHIRSLPLPTRWERVKIGAFIPGDLLLVFGTSYAATVIFLVRVLTLICGPLIAFKASRGGGSSGVSFGFDMRRRVKSTGFVRGAIRACPHLLWKTNSDGETPLHLAACLGYTDVLAVLIDECATLEDDIEKGVKAVTRLMGMTNEAEDTALHLAVRQNHLDVVEKLLSKSDQYQLNNAIQYGPNNAGETPLYLAAERGFQRVVHALLKNSGASQVDGGPNGKTALHAAAIRGDAVITKMILEDAEKSKSLPKKEDDKGWIPLHYAADLGSLAVVILLLDANVSLAYKPTKKEKMVALHLAARTGSAPVMAELICRCPSCCDLVDDRGRNVIHFAIESGKKEAIKYVLNNPFLNRLLNKNDDQGNPPLHLLRQYSYTHFKAFNSKNRNALDIILPIYDLVNNRRGFVERLKKPGTRARQRHVEEEDKAEGTMISSKEANEAMRNDLLSLMRDARQSHLVVATLIATVTFAAGFTLPGGYKDAGDPEEGGAILTRRRAFQAFVISDTVALMLSIAAILLYFLLAKVSLTSERVFSVFGIATDLVVYATVAMVVAFLSGMYSVLLHSSLLAISVCVVGGFFFVACPSSPLWIFRSSVPATVVFMWDPIVDLQ